MHVIYETQKVNWTTSLFGAISLIKPREVGRFRTNNSRSLSRDFTEVHCRQTVTQFNFVRQGRDTWIWHRLFRASGTSLWQASSRPSTSAWAVSAQPDRTERCH